MPSPDHPPRPRLWHPLFTGLGGALLIAALFTDGMYASNALMQWANFSAWLIAGGLVLALVAALVLLVERTIGRAGPLRRPDFALLAAATVLSVINVLVHSRDAWTSVVPGGIALSAIVAILLGIVGARGWQATALPGDGA